MDSISKNLSEKLQLSDASNTLISSLRMLGYRKTKRDSPNAYILYKGINPNKIIIKVYTGLCLIWIKDKSQYTCSLNVQSVLNYVEEMLEHAKRIRN